MPRNLRHAWAMQRANAQRRGIGFELTFEEWLSVWTKSKRLSQRGRKAGCFVMARVNDKGTYSLGNVKIIRMERNSAEAWSFKTPEQVTAWKAAAARGGYANRGRPRPDLAERNRRRAVK